MKPPNGLAHPPAGGRSAAAGPARRHLNYRAISGNALRSRAAEPLVGQPVGFLPVGGGQHRTFPIRCVVIILALSRSIVSLSTIHRGPIFETDNAGYCAGSCVPLCSTQSYSAGESH